MPPHSTSTLRTSRTTRLPRRNPGDWFTPWFNSPYYHALYRNRDENEARFFMDNLVRFQGIGSDSTILDLGCGRGRHAVYLSSTGAHVTGIDIARESIEYARRFENARLRFEVGDMRRGYGEQRFSEILNLFTSFGYFGGHDDNLRVLRHAARALRPGGSLVIDFLNAEKAIRGLVPHEVKQVEGARFEISRGVEDGFIVKDVHVHDGGTSRHFQERVQALVLDDFLTYFRKVGLHLLHALGSYDLSSFRASTSDRLILVAQKPS